VQQGDTLSPLLFILAINPALQWINKPDQGYTLCNSTHILVSTYANDIALMAENAAGIRTMFNKLIAFGQWAGLEINPNKSAYTVAQDAMQADLHIPSTHNSIPVTAPIPFLPPATSYRYMGVMINVDLDWNEQLQHMHSKVEVYQHLIQNKQLTTANKIYVSNADQGWQAWPKLQDLDWVGHFTQDPTLAHSLVGRGILQWSQLVQGGQLRPRTQITDVTGVVVSPHMYEHISRALASLPAVPTPVRSAECALQEISKFSPREGELHDLHYHIPTNTLTIFMDGSCKGGLMAAGVYFGKGSKRNRAFQVPIEPMSMLAKLHTIEEVLICALAGVNICVTMDSKSSIDTIATWPTKALAIKQTRVGANVITCICKHLATLSRQGQDVRFQHIYSHIMCKTTTATAKGHVEVEAFSLKVANLKMQLWGPFDHWVEGNEGANALADLGHNLLLVIEPWSMPACSPKVVIFDNKGNMVDGNICCKALQKTVAKWAIKMLQKLV
jgi:hypothetical protein